MFVYRKARKRPIYVAKSRQDDKRKKILQRIQDMLDEYEENLTLAFIAMWAAGDEINAADVTDVSGYKQTLEDFTEETLRPIMDKAGDAGFSGAKEDTADIINVPEFDESENHTYIDDTGYETNQFDYNAFYSQWCDERAGNLITELTDTQRANVKSILNDALQSGSYSVNSVANRVRDTIGLTERQLNTNQRYYNTVRSTLQENNPKMSDEELDRRAAQAALKMAEKQRRARARNIARTELSTAHNQAANAYVQWAIEHGYMKNVLRKWVTSGNSNVCPICLALSGKTVPFAESYSSVFGTVKCPPAHPQCCCGEQFLEGDGTVPETQSEWDKMTEAQKKAHINYYSDKEQYKQYKKVLGKETVPKTFDKFQELKYTDSEKWKFMKLDYSRQNTLINHPEYALPNADTATADNRKFTEYLFSSNNAKGWSKGQAFTSRLGYDINNYTELKKEILNSAVKYPATAKETDIYGTKYEQRIILYGNKGTPANVVVGWKRNENSTWLTSVYIKEIKNEN